MHAVLNALKRLVVIGLGALYTGEHLSAGFAAGAIVAVAGASTYSLAKVLHSSAAHVWLRIGMFALVAASVGGTFDTGATGDGLNSGGQISLKPIQYKHASLAQGVTQVVSEAGTSPWIICDRLPLKSSEKCMSDTLLAPIVKPEALVQHGQLVDGQHVLKASQKPRGCDGRALKVVAMSPPPSKHDARCLPSGLTFKEAEHPDHRGARRPHLSRRHWCAVDVPKP